MREYRFQASEESVDALRRLRGSWAGVFVAPRVVTVALADGTLVRIWVGAADVEGVFDAYRLVAVSTDTMAELESRMSADDETDDIPRIELPTDLAQFDPPEDLALPGNDIVLFTGVSWSEAGSASVSGNGASTIHFHGHPGQLSERAELVCITTDGMVVAASSGEGILVRTGLAPYSLQVSRDAEVIAAFLRERAYSSE